MIIVSGEPRSGTSLMMETLRLLGLSIWGDEKLEDNLRTINNTEFEKRVLRERKSNLNEKFWEVGGIVMKGLKPYSLMQRKQLIAADLTATEEEKKEQINRIDKHINLYEEHKNDAVKIIWNGLIQTDFQILKESKIILCIRHPLHIAESQRNLEGSLKVAEEVDGNPLFLSPKSKLSPFRYLNSAKRYINWIQEENNENLQILNVSYDNMQFDSKRTILKIIRFLELDINQEQLNLAINNINPKKRRSAIDKSQITENQEEWILIDELYNAIAEGEYEFANARIKEYEIFQKTNPENAKWIDEETFFPMTPDLFRTMEAKEKMKEQMKKSKKNREADNLLCKSCPFYNRDGEEYEIKLPLDIPNVKRNSVKCGPLKKDITLEECQHHWQSIHHKPLVIENLKKKMETD